MSTKKRAKIALRDRVWADAAHALGPSRFHAVYGPGAVAQIIHGTVLEMVGQGHGRKWRVAWDTGDISTMTTASLKVALDAPTRHSVAPPQNQSVAGAIAASHQHPSSSSSTGSVAVPSPSAPSSAPFGVPNSQAPDSPTPQPSMHSVGPAQPAPSSPLADTPGPPSPTQSSGVVSSAQPSGELSESLPASQMQATRLSKEEKERQKEELLRNPDSFVVHGVEWKRARELVQLGQGAIPDMGSPHCRSLFDNLNDDILNQFLLAFPVNLLDMFVAGTSANLARKKQAKTTRGEMLRAIGAIIGMAEAGVSSLDYCYERKKWVEDLPEGSVSYASYDFEACFRLSKTRLQEILSSLAVVDDEVADADARESCGGTRANDPFGSGSIQSAEPAFEAFNEARQSLKFEPSRHLCIDESMSAFVTKLHLPVQ